MTRRTRALFAAVCAGLVLLTTSPAFASPGGYGDDPPPTDNGKWTGVIFAVVLVIVAAGCGFIAKAYLKNSNHE
ncbi:MAG: hypothetical protein QM655_10780 [Nocardioidaceae bacterium]